MSRLPPLLILLSLTGCLSLPGSDDLAKEQRLYYLPWAAGQSFRCIQPGPGSFSHEGRDEHAVDFAMPEGTALHAARGGVVLAVKDDSDRGGSTREFAADGNYVHIGHADGTRSVYLHLRHDGAAVAVGARVRQGDLVGFSGGTGWSTTPHLHFAVERPDPETRRWVSIPFAFIEVPGSGVPRFLGRYRSRNHPTAIPSPRNVGVAPGGMPAWLAFRIRPRRAERGKTQ